ncbi:hypothetical protein [Oleidesulfovibrio sp.]|uniref:hypothetical protein n=1 Tax=Oleidesulfovibrio sp. TaxID=2909707 RepID=UPI003A85C57C
MLYDEFDWLDTGVNSPSEWQAPAAAQRSTSILHDEAAFMRLPVSTLLASDIFQAVYARKRIHAQKVRITTTDPTRSISYTGERLDQFDLDVLLASLGSSALAGMQSGRCAAMRLGGIARAMNRTDDDAVRHKVGMSLYRMAAGLLEISSGKRSYTLRLINRLLLDLEEGRCVVEFTPQVMAAFRELPDMHSFTRSRFALDVHSLARWMHGIVHVSSEVCIPYEQLLRLSGNAAARPDAFSATARRLQIGSALPLQQKDNWGIIITRHG